MRGLRAKIDYILKHNAFISRVFIGSVSICLKFVGLFVRTRNNTVIFSGHSRKYNDSPRVIYEYMLSQPRFSDMHFIWALENPEEGASIPGNPEIVKADTFKYFRRTLAAKYWITCVNIDRNLKYKKKKTKYLNTWHGTPLKTIGNSAAGRKDYNFSHINLFCSAGEYEKEIYIRDFCLRPESIINTGLPRNDELYSFSETEKNEIRERLGIPADKKVILYAPTWRDSKDKGKEYAIKPPMDVSKWKDKLSGEYVLLFRTHPYTNKLLGIQFDDFVMDYTNYPVINDLLKIADILISDYSATVFDYSILERPIVCFAYDYETYAKERGLYADLNEVLPGGVVYDEDSVINRILSMNYEKECELTKAFKEKFLEFGGNATEICVEKLFN